MGELFPASESGESWISPRRPYEYVVLQGGRPDRPRLAPMGYYCCPILMLGQGCDGLPRVPLAQLHDFLDYDGLGKAKEWKG